MRYPVTTKAGIIGGLAYCRDCDWRNEGYKNALATAKIHAGSHGHTVDVEQTTSVTYSAEGQDND